MQAAAKTYFGKALKDLTLAQMALLAAIPQSPTKFDLVKNADRGCRIGTTTACPTASPLVVPDTTEVVARRNYILDLMKTPSVAAVGEAPRHRRRVEAAKDEPVVLAPQVVASLERARTSCGRSAASSARSCAATRPPTPATKIDTGGYTVTTTLDWRMQRDRREVALRRGAGPNRKSPTACSGALKIPKPRLGLDARTCGAGTSTTRRGGDHRLPDRPGPRLRRLAPRYTAAGNKKFQPQFDVLDGRLAPARIVDQADRLPRSVSTTRR